MATDRGSLAYYTNFAQNRFCTGGWGGAPNENPRDNGIICDARPPRETRRTFCVLKLVSAAPARMGICYMSGWLGTKATRLARARVCVCVCVCNANNDHFPIQMAARINRAFGCMRVVWGPHGIVCLPPHPRAKYTDLKSQHSLESFGSDGARWLEKLTGGGLEYRWEIDGETEWTTGEKSLLVVLLVLLMPVCAAERLLANWIRELVAARL